MTIQWQYKLKIDWVSEELPVKIKQYKEFYRLNQLDLGYSYTVIYGCSYKLFIGCIITITLFTTLYLYFIILLKCKLTSGCNLSKDEHIIELIIKTDKLC
jgi:hypothetical protein